MTPPFHIAVLPGDGIGPEVTKAALAVLDATLDDGLLGPALVSLIASNDRAVYDYIAFRRDIEARSAERGAS